MQNDDVCPVCYEDIANEARVTLQCAHEYHATCAAKWVDASRNTGKKPTCPMCRSKVKELDASRLAGPCAQCGRAELTNGALVCTGRLCMDGRGTSKWDAKSKCYDCAIPYSIRQSPPVEQQDYLQDLANFTCDGCRLRAVGAKRRRHTGR